MPGVRETLSRFPWSDPSGPRLGLASNQDQVAYGFLSADMARRLLRDLALAATGVVPADPAIQLCPHALNVECDCRKPRPGMLLRIMEHYGIGPEKTVFVGNDPSDCEAAERAGINFVWAESLFRQTSQQA